MSPFTFALISGSGWAAIFVFTHLALARAAGVPRHGRIIIRCFALSIAGFLTTLAALHGKLWQGSSLAWLLAAGSGILLMACAFVLYVPLVFVISSSLSVDTLILLERAGGRLPRVALYRRFAAAEAARRRLEIMRKSGLLTLEGGRYRLTPKAAALAQFFAEMKRLWNLQPGG